MIDTKTLKTAPVPLLKYNGLGHFEPVYFNHNDCATMYWLHQDNGESYHLSWWTNGWVVHYQESYLTDNGFEHKNDIKSFEHSHIGSASGWKHVYLTREDAVAAYIENYCTLRGIKNPNDNLN